jgi:hypothetical protein
MTIKSSNTFFPVTDVLLLLRYARKWQMPVAIQGCEIFIESHFSKEKTSLAITIEIIESLCALRYLFWSCQQSSLVIPVFQNSL